MKTFGQLAQDLREFFSLTFTPHLGLGRKVLPMYVVNPVAEFVAVYQDNPTLVQNTYVTIKERYGSGLIHSICTDMTTAGETLQFRITVDGVAITTSAVACNADTDYWWWIFPAGIAYALGGYAGTTEDLVMCHKGSLPYRDSIKVEVQKTTAAGANACNVCIMASEW